MLYAVICTDKPDGLALRMANRPEHVAYLQSLGDRLVIAGPLTGRWPIGRIARSSVCQFSTTGNPMTNTVFIRLEDHRLTPEDRLAELLAKKK